jgi:beta-galactosidase
MRAITFLMLCTFAGALIAQDAPPSGDAPAPTNAARWSETKAVATSPLRGEMRLDGAWRFAPTAAKEAPEQGWGWISVPGSWRDERSVLARGTAAWWASFDRKTLRGAWYEREITVPAEWKGRAILLDVSRVSTDATVYIDGQRCGAIAWPEGTIDVSAVVKPGTPQRLRLHVVATLDKNEVMVLMGDLPGQNSVAKAEVQSGGLTGPVRLLARPAGAHIDEVFVRTSVRRGELAFDLDLADVATAGDVAIEAVIAGTDGVQAKRFTATVAAKAAERQTVTVAWPWADAKRWDVGEPNLYVATIGARGAGIADAYPQRFGFRECWIDGRTVMLNGSAWRMRPMLRQPNTPDLAREALARGYTFCELWPGDPWERSSPGYEVNYGIADEAGLPINGVTAHMGWHGTNIMNPAKLAAYRAACARLIRRSRNHPSIVMWGTSGNMTGGSKTPATVGQREAARAEDIARSGEDYRKVLARAEAGLAIHRELDPTRPVFIHNGASSGDLYTINNYLTGIPLQEREEWLSTYVEKGDMPLMYCEFGTPVSLDYMRGRKGFNLAAQSEPLLSEFLAIELGAAAYRDETAAYRKVIRGQFHKDQTYRWMHGVQDFFRLPAFLEVQERFITNTWRSWRTMGLTGGMIPWDDGYFKLDDKVTRAGTAMLAANGPTLAWICGPAIEGDRAAFTAKDHSYAAGTRVAKRVALLNDSRAPRAWSLTWRATLGGREVGTGRAEGSLAVGETAFAPLAFALPAKLAADKADGEITLEARIGDITHNDRFAFRAFAPLVPLKGEVLVHDPAGRTSALLKQLGYRAVPWTGAADAKRLLVIGRQAFTAAKPLPGDLAAFVRDGGRAIIQAQDPHHVRGMRGMRVSYKASRRVYLADPAHPAVAGLDAEDLRDWSGHGTLLEAKPDYVHGSGPDVALAPTTLPYAGWRWGLRGTVATGAPEKPHRAGWRPILECEFDLAYSPLMELDLGRGHVVWCQLDLEDHAAVDPAAARLARQVLEYARTAPLAPRVTTTYLGGDRGAALLEQVGLTYQRATALPAQGLAVIGADASVDQAALEAFATKGGRVLVLPRAQADAGFGLRLVKRDDHLGSLTPPAWPEGRGLSASDLRVRVESPAWVIADGAEAGADGLIGRRAVGGGVVIFCQVDPDRFDADKRTYLRFSRWRSTRALAQLLANLGGAFALDDRVFAAQPPATPAQAGMYHADHRADWDLGDEPSRYYNW